MSNPTSLLEDGDEFERRTWPNLRSCFSCYETFWSVFIVPLREPNQICIRQNVAEKLQCLAQSHYKCYAALASAHELLKKDSTAHPERIFSHLQNSSNEAKKVMSCFAKVAQSCIGQAGVTLDHSGLEKFASGIAVYRNFVHEGMMAHVVREGHIYIPKTEKLKKYKLWSKLQNAPIEDLTHVKDEVQSKFDELCELLESCCHLNYALRGAPEEG